MTVTADVVPLPDVLSTCTCPNRPRMHKLDCAIAIAHDDTPLSERPEYELGQRFAAISWDYPLRLHATLNIEVQLDPVAVIVDNADRYARFVGEGDEEDKPIEFIIHLMEEQADFGGISFGKRRMSTSWCDFECDAWRDWKPEMTDAVNAALARRVDPNQTALDL